jgi:ribosomal protein S27E
MTAPRTRDAIVPGSARTVTYHEEVTLVTVRCGRCSHEQETRASAQSTRCKGCGRTCRLTASPAPNVIPLRRTA